MMLLSLSTLAEICALRDDRSGFYQNIKEAAKTKEVRKDSLFDPFDWVILRDIRKDVDFKDKIERPSRKPKIWGN